MQLDLRKPTMQRQEYSLSPRGYGDAGGSIGCRGPGEVGEETTGPVWLAVDFL